MRRHAEKNSNTSSPRLKKPVATLSPLRLNVLCAKIRRLAQSHPMAVVVIERLVERQLAEP